MSSAPFLSSLKPGDVILVNPTGFDFGSLPIRLANFYKRGFKDRLWMHAALYLGNGEVVEAFPDGIKRRKLEDAYIKKGNFRVLALRRLGLAQPQIEKWCRFVESEISAKYDMRAIIYFALYVLVPPQFQSWILDTKAAEKAFNVEGSYTCSELVASGLKECGVGAYCFENKPSRVMPVDFYNELNFEKVGFLEPEKDMGFVAKAARWCGKALGILFYILMVPVGFLLSLLLVVVGVGLVALAVAGVMAFAALLGGVLLMRQGEVAQKAQPPGQDKKA